MPLNPFHGWQYLGYAESIAIAKNKLLIGIAQVQLILCQVIVQEIY